MLEHTVTFLSVRYEGVTVGEGLPIPDSLWDTPEYAQCYERMGEQGWELVSVTPLPFKRWLHTV